MQWLDYVLTAIGGSLTALIGSIFYFRPKLKAAKADASMKEVESQNYQYQSLLDRINSMEKLYGDQSQIIEELRKEIIKLSAEKFSNEKRIIQLESENKALTGKVNQLEREVNAYKTITQR